MGSMHQKQRIMKSIVEQTRTLPTGVVGNVLTFIPRNETAQLMMDASANDKLALTYLRKYKVEEGDYKDELYGTLAPSVMASNMYGDDESTMKIIRTRISLGEKLRMKEKSIYMSTNAHTHMEIQSDAEEDEDGFIEFE